MRIRSKNPPPAIPRRRGCRRRLGKSLRVGLLPLEEDSRFQRLHEPEGDRVGQSFDVIKNYLLILVNTGRRELRIQGSRSLPPGNFLVLEKFTFEKFDWFTRYRLSVETGRRRCVLIFDIPDHIPGESDYLTMPVIDKKAYRIPHRLVRI